MNATANQGDDGSGAVISQVGTLAPRAHDILRILLGWIEGGAATALVTLVGIEGNSSRSPGTLMAVAADGRHVGSFSAGCIETAIVAQAIEAIAEQRGRTVRYGVGSPYIDLRLPCGGGIDLTFTPTPDAAVIRAALSALDRRETASVAVMENGIATGCDPTGYALTLVPPLRVLAYGQGEDLAVFARLASFFGAVVEVVSPDESLPGEFGTLPVTVHRVETHHRAPRLSSDPWTAIVFLFHDHDWEGATLPAALAMPAFYHGAIGSRRTQHARLRMLENMAVDPALVKRLRGRIGLIASTRDPATLALSILSEVVAAYREIVATGAAANNEPCAT
ncbi:XdhC family protein [Croceicoccus ponticola]|uniref:XdhC family protein n=1 Tax=Croceicoccus ponticola TaxID=2217664 RepID=UPI001F0C15B6|nr:XdhC family protein [Croceicoccus ponticola]